MWKGRKPSYKYLRVWGCLAKVEVPPPKQVAIGPKTNDCIFIPNMTVGTAIESRNAVFFENIFPHKETVQQENAPSGESAELEKRKRTDSSNTEIAEPRRSKRARTEKNFGQIL